MTYMNDVNYKSFINELVIMVLYIIHCTGFTILPHKNVYVII